MTRLSIFDRSSDSDVSVPPACVDFASWFKFYPSNFSQIERTTSRSLTDGSILRIISIELVIHKMENNSFRRLLCLAFSSSITTSPTSSLRARLCNGSIDTECWTCESTSLFFILQVMQQQALPRARPVQLFQICYQTFQDVFESHQMHEMHL